jgi:Cof subfamily protein (haloacid dehalogenase superfamily)
MGSHSKREAVGQSVGHENSSKKPAVSVGAPRVHVHAGEPIKLVALDLDGTLLNSKKAITPGTHRAIRAVLEKGVKVVLATARPPRSVVFYHERLGLDTPMINYNGALIWDRKSRKALSHVPLSRDIARKVIALARKRHPKLLVHVEILDKWYTDHFDEHPEYITETGKSFMPDFIGPIESFTHVDVTKLMLLGKPEWILDLEAQIPKKIGDAVAFTRSDEFLLQLMSPGVSKANGLELLAKKFSIEPRNVMACGDAPNDVHMMQWAGLAIAPENAFDIAKSTAHHVVASNDHEGIADALRRFVLGHKAAPAPAPAL